MYEEVKGSHVLLEKKPLINDFISISKMLSIFVVH